MHTVDADRDCTACFALLPPELLLDVLAFAVTASPPPSLPATLAAFARINKLCAAIALPLLYERPCLASLANLDRFLRVVEDPSTNRADAVRRLKIEGRVFASRGFGHGVQRALKACTRVEQLEVVGIDDLRPKQFLGQGALTHLTLLNSSFRPHSHTAPPNLAPFLAFLTHLTVANVGLPTPSSHLTEILRCCATTLRYLAISSLRDIDAVEFRRAFEILVDHGTALESLVIGFLTDEQTLALHSRAPRSSEAGSYSEDDDDDENDREATTALGPSLLSRLPVLANVTFTLPLPTLPLLLALPPSLRRLTIRPPYARPSGTSVREHSRSSLLSVLSRSPSTTSNTPRQSNPATPVSTLGGGGGGGVEGGIRRMSVTLEQLEEEEAAVLAIEEALAKGAAIGLVEIRWECRALRSARGRLEAAMEDRRRRI
ncbi:hypothetical protein JCM3774_006228 [Rhodotorula dairenensis]